MENDSILIALSLRLILECHIDLVEAILCLRGISERKTPCGGIIGDLYKGGAQVDSDMDFLAQLLLHNLWQSEAPTFVTGAHHNSCDVTICIGALNFAH